MFTVYTLGACERSCNAAFKTWKRTMSGLRRRRQHQRSDSSHRPQAQAFFMSDVIVSALPLSGEYCVESQAPGVVLLYQKSKEEASGKISGSMRWRSCRHAIFRRED